MKNVYWNGILKPNLQWTAILIVALVIVSCVTEKTESPEAKKYSEMIGKACVTQRTVANYKITSKIVQEVEIFSMKKSRNGWIVIDAAVSGVRDNIYHNEARSIFVCGSTSFRKQGYIIEQ